MKISKNIFICVILTVLVLLCISAVSAEDSTLNTDDGDVLGVDNMSDFRDSLSPCDDASPVENDRAIESDSGLGGSDNYVYSYNFFDFFDEDGCMYDNLPYSSLTFADTFENLNVSRITVRSPMVFTGYSDVAKFNNIAFDILSNNVSLSGVTLNYNGDDAAINVFGNDVKLNDLTINYETKRDTFAFAVHVTDSNGFRLEGSTINFKSNSVGTKGYYQHTIQLRDSERIVITKNNINSELPACDVIYDVDIEGIDHDLVLVIGIQSGDDITISDNVIKTDVTGGYGELPTLDSIMADSFRNLKIINNTITQTDMSNEGRIGYSYAVDLYGFNTANISRNDIFVDSKAGVDGYGSVYPIQLSGPYTNLVVEANKLTAMGKGPALGIFSQNSAGPTEITVLNNIIDVVGYASKTSLYSLVSGMELQDSLARVYNNTIYTGSIDEYDDDNHLYGISYAQWFTNGHMYDIRNNTVITTGKYAVYLSNARYSNVTGNDLEAHNLLGDSSVEILSGDNNTVENNVPPYEAEIIIDNSDVLVGFNKTVTVTIPHATFGNLVIIVNGKDYRGLKIMYPSVSVVVDSEYIVAGLNNITVMYGGDKMVLPGEEKTTFRALDGKITNETFSDYFDVDGNLYDFVPEGAVLDFEGLFVGGKYCVNINKAVNIITSTGDATFEGADLKFAILEGADYTNLTGITFSKASLSIRGAGHVTVDGVNMSGAGLTVEPSSGYNTIKNGRFETTSAYAVDLTTSANNMVINNYLSAKELSGDDAVRFVEGMGNVVRDNTPIGPGLDVSVSDITLGENATVEISLKSDINDNVLVVLDGRPYTVQISSGKGKLTVPGLDAGRYTVGVYFMGDESYTKSAKFATFNVNKLLPEINIKISDAKLGEDVVVNVTVAGAKGYVSIVVDSIENNVLLENGSAVYTIKTPGAGNHSVVVAYGGDDRYCADLASASFKLMEYQTKFTNITINGGNVLTAYLVDETGSALGNTLIKFTINGVEFDFTTTHDGSITIHGVADSVIVLKFDGQTPFLSTDLTINLKNAPAVRTSTELFADDFTQYSCDYAAGERGGFFKVQLKDVNGKPLVNKTIAVGFNGVVGYYQTDSAGWIQKQIALQNAGEYTFASIFLGDDEYKASFIVNKITVIKKPTSISASSKSFKVSATKKSYSATLKTVAGSSIDGKVYLSAGKKITFTVNGQIYTAKTDSNGNAKVNLKLTKKGTYTVKVSFAGDGAYKESSASAKITIK